MKPSERINQIVDELIKEEWKKLGNPRIPIDVVRDKTSAKFLTYFQAICRFLDERIEGKRSK